MEWGLLGDSIHAWKGPCHVSFEHMVDGEDLREKSAIEGSMMLHWIVELFDQNLTAGVFFQRVMADHVRALIEERTSHKFHLRRDGDDLYFENKKLSISIATRSPNSVLIHFAVNISNQGTPVATCSLEDFGLDPDSFAVDVMERVAKEWASVREATWKVRPVC
jgi:hypothetical protein